MRRLDSLVMRVAGATSVPAGGALAVDRDRFAQGVTDALDRHPLITIRREEVHRIPDSGDARSPVIVATGPLTSDALSTDSPRSWGTRNCTSTTRLVPIVLAESIERSKVFRASRWGAGTTGTRRSGFAEESCHARWRTETILTAPE